MRVADLSGTATDRVDVNLMVARGQTGGDNLIDRVFIDGTFGNDTINVNGAGPDVRDTGLAAITTVRGTDPELDRLHVDTKLGVDPLTVTGTTNQLIGVHVLLICSRSQSSNTASMRWPRSSRGRKPPVLPSASNCAASARRSAAAADTNA